MRAIGRSLVAAVTLLVLGTGPASGTPCPTVPGDVAPGLLAAELAPPGWTPVGDGHVDVADAVVLVRAAVGLQLVEVDEPGIDGCPLRPGDLAPGELDPASATWRVLGDGRLDVSDVVVSLRAAVGQLTIARPDDPASPRLVATGSADCPEMLDELRAHAVEQMERELDLQLQRALEPLRYGCWYLYEDVDADGVPGGVAGAGATEYSETNVQVEGVDEADLVKTDGAHVYVLADGRLQVLDAWPATETHRVGSLEIEGEPKRMFIHGDTAVVFSSLDPLLGPTPLDWFGPWGRVGANECTYGYDCEFTGDGRRVKVTVVDVSRREEPRATRAITFDASYLSSRRIGDVVHLVTTAPESAARLYEVWPTETLGTPDHWYYVGCESGQTSEFTEEQVVTAFARLRQANRDRLAAASATDLLPGWQDVRGDGSRVDGLLGDCGSAHRSLAGDGTNLLSLVSFDLTSDGPLATSSILSRPGSVYASGESLYVAVRHHRWDVDGWFFPDTWNVQESTTIHAFALTSDPPGSRYVASGAVEGRLLNQFSMDEHEGDLRVATSTGWAFQQEAHSQVFVLRHLKDRLVVVGEVDGIAPTEDIRSVRFVGDRGYVVTFKKTDPLFVLDLAEPRRPRIVGELHVPGFSTYLHPFGDGHLLAMGYDADDEGSFAWFQGLLLQVFDVTDPTTPLLAHREVIGTRGSTSEAATNHLAFTYFSARDALAVPLTICEDGSGGGAYGDRMTFSGLRVYRVTVDDGFELLGGVPHRDPEPEPSPRSACGSWWTDSSSVVKRSVFLEDWVFSISDDLVQVAGLGDLDQPVATVDLHD